MVFLLGLALHIGQGSADLGLAQLHGFASGCDYWATLLLLAGLEPAGLSLFHMFLILLGLAGLPSKVLLIVILEV